MRYYIMSNYFVKIRSIVISNNLGARRRDTDDAISYKSKRYARLACVLAFENLSCCS